jgi:hypothetical protein
VEARSRAGSRPQHLRGLRERSAEPRADATANRGQVNQAKRVVAVTTRLWNEAPREWMPVAEPSADHSAFGSWVSSWQSFEWKRPSVSSEAAARLWNEAPREWMPAAEPSADHSAFGSWVSSWQSFEWKRPLVSSEAAAKVAKPAPGDRGDLLNRQQTQHLRALCEQSGGSALKLRGVEASAEPVMNRDTFGSRGEKPGWTRTTVPCGADVRDRSGCAPTREQRDVTYRSLTAASRETVRPAVTAARPAPSGAGFELLDWQ